MVAPDGSVIEINQETIPLYFEWAHGQILSTVHDMFTFFSALGSGQLYSHTETLDLMFTGSPLSTEESYGLGIFLYHNKYGIGHTGGTLGFITYVMINPETNFVNIICFNEYDVSNSQSNSYMEETLVEINNLIFNE